MMNKRNNRKQRKPRNNNRINHSPLNLDQQQNVISTRRTNKVKDCKLRTKYWYDTGYQQNIVLGGNVIQIITPKQGVQSDNRIGDKILVKKIEMKYVIASPPSDAYNMVRLLVVYSTTPSLALPNWLDSDLATSNIDPLSFTKPYATGTSFQILYDQTHIMNVSSSNAAVHNEISIPTNLPSTWDYAQNFESGYFAFVWLGDSNFSPHPILTYNIRTQYVDI